MGCRNELFGIAILWILFFHIYVNLGINGGGRLSTVISKILVRGNMGVDIFLFLSAVGLCKSIENNNTVTFYRHRFNRVVLPYLIVAVLFFVWFDFCWAKDGVIQFFLNVTTINYWLTGNHPTWYIAFIVIMYLLFPLLYQWDKKTMHVSSVCIIFLSIFSEYLMYKMGFFLFSTAERALLRIPVFMVGLIAAPTLFSNRKILPWQILAVFLGGLWLYAIISIHPPYIVLTRYLYCPIGIAIIVCYTYIRQNLKLQWLWKVIAWVGSLSLELYVVHVLIRRLIRETNSWTMVPPMLWWFLIPIVSLLLALILQCLTKKIKK